MTQKAHLQQNDKRLLCLLLVVFIACAWAYSAMVPPYENQDEIEHTEVIRHIAVTGRLPIHEEAESAGFRTRQESSQPPLYHILEAGWVRMWGLPLDANTWQAKPAEVVACGEPATLYDKATWRYDPDVTAESPFIRTLYIERLFSILLAAAGLAGLYVLARRVFPKSLLPVFVVGIVAFNPQFLFISSGVNNDNLMTALAMWGMLLAFDLWDKGPTVKRVLMMSVLAGLGGLTKLSGLGLVGLGGLAILLYAVRTRMPFGKLVGWGALTVLPAVLILAPWLLRNHRLYGDLTALAPMLEEVGHRESGIDWGEMRLMLLSYWGQTPCSFYPQALYWPFFLLLGGGLIGVLLRIKRFDVRQRIMLFLSAIWFVVIGLAWLRWDLITFAPGGRLLFPASGALALILAAGWAKLFPRSVKVWAVILPILALVTLRMGPMAIFGRPPVVDALPDAITPMDYEFGDAVALRGYTVDVREKLWLCKLTDKDVDCDPELAFTLVWERVAPLDADWTMVVQLVSPVPGDTTLRYNLNKWPGHGNMPTGAFPDGLVVDHYTVPLGVWDWTQAWTFAVGFTYDGERIPITSGGSGETAFLEMIRVPGDLRSVQETHPQDIAASIGDIIVLASADATIKEDHFAGRLVWQAHSETETDFAVFIHAYAEDGTLLGTADNPPGYYAFPTSMYEADDTHVYGFELDADPDWVTSIAVGLYDPTTGVRLPVSSHSHVVRDNAVIIWEAE